jgi:hypothetical protein
MGLAAGLEVRVGGRDAVARKSLPFGPRIVLEERERRYPGGANEVGKSRSAAVVLLEGGEAFGNKRNRRRIG